MLSAGVPIAPDALPDNPAELKRIIAAMAQDALTAEAEIARLKFQLARYRRAEFGRSSEKLTRETEPPTTRRRSSFRSAGGAAIEGAAQGKHGDYDDQLHRSSARPTLTRVVGIATQRVVAVLSGDRCSAAVSPISLAKALTRSL